MEKVFVYKNSNGDYKVHPAVVVLSGGNKLRVVNTTTVTIKVTLPAGASKPSDPETKEIAPQDKDDFTTRSQGSDKTKSYNYDVMTKSSQIAAHGNSDPVLIIEN